MRTVASQMPDARGRSVTLRLGGHVERRTSRRSSAASGRTYEFLGFRMAYVDVSDEPAHEDERGATSRPSARAKASRATGIDAVGPLDPAAGALHRGEPGEGARRARRSAGRRRTRRSSTRSRTSAATSGRRATRSSRRGPRSRRRSCSSATSPTSSTTTSPRRWRRRSTRSRPGGPRPRSGCTPSTSGTAPPGLQRAGLRGEPRQDRHERGQHDPHRRPTTTATPRSSCGSWNTGEYAAPRRARSARSPPTSRPTS